GALQRAGQPSPQALDDFGLLGADVVALGDLSPVLLSPRQLLSRAALQLVGRHPSARDPTIRATSGSAPSRENRSRASASAARRERFWICATAGDLVPDAQTSRIHVPPLASTR